MNYDELLFLAKLFLVPAALGLGGWALCIWHDSRIER